MYIYSYLFGLY